MSRVLHEEMISTEEMMGTEEAEALARTTVDSVTVDSKFRKREIETEEMKT